MSEVKKTPKGVIAGSRRLPVRLHHRLVREAEKACRSLNSEIIWRLEQSLRAQEPA
jgi:hypothetical protein